MPRHNKTANIEKLHKNDKRRQRIQATKLIDRLHEAALGKEELSLARIRCIEILLKKTLPDLATVQIVGDENRPLKMEYTWKPYQEPKTIDVTPDVTADK